MASQYPFRGWHYEPLAPGAECSDWRKMDKAFLKALLRLNMILKKHGLKVDDWSIWIGKIKESDQDWIEKRMKERTV